jgi:hypothetical protein
MSEIGTNGGHPAPHDPCDQRSEFETEQIILFTTCCYFLAVSIHGVQSHYLKSNDANESLLNVAT